MKSPNGLSDRELICRLRNLIKREQNLTLEIVPHLVEVVRRGLHLGKGYGSLYEYCKGELGYTDASAWRRARAAQAIIRCPEAWERLREGGVNLCKLGRVYKFIAPAVLREICGKSKAEVELIAAACDAKGVSPDRTRPVMVPKVASERPGTPVRSAKACAAATAAARLRCGGSAPEKREVLPLRSEGGTGRLEFEQKWKIEVVVSKEVKEKLDRCKSLLSRKYPQGVDYEILLGELAEMSLDRLDPKRSQDRRKQRAAKRKHRAEAATKAPESRHIAAVEKERVWIRDRGRCAYVGTNGKNCNSTYNLQFDHYPIPFARGGPSKASNLRLLCAKHNRYTAEKTFGRRE